MRDIMSSKDKDRWKQLRYASARSAAHAQHNARAHVKQAEQADIL